MELSSLLERRRTDPIRVSKRIFCVSMSLLCVGVLVPFILEQVLNYVGRTMVVMSPENQSLWAEVPGQTNMVINRTYYFYNFSNSDAFLFNGSTPEMVRIGPFKYQEYQNFTNINFTADGTQFDYNFWNYMHSMDPWDDRDYKIGMVNMFPLVAFSQIKSAPKEMITIQALGTLVIQLEQLTVVQAQGQAIYMLYLNTEQKQRDYLKYFSRETQDIIMADQDYGTAGPVPVINWVLAAQEYSSLHQNMGQKCLEIKAHFHLTDLAIIQMIEQLLPQMQLVTDILQDQYCPVEGPCHASHLAALQWAQSGISNNNPIGTNYPSIVFLNSSAQGYPELNYYFKEKFLPSLPPEERLLYQNLSFPLEWAKTVLKHNPNISEWTQDWNTLLHVGNLKWVFQQGSVYRESQALSSLQALQTRFNCSSLYMARVLFEYLDYIATDFAVAEPRGGTKEMLGVAALGTQGLYKYYSAIKDTLPSNLTDAYLLFRVDQDSIDLSHYVPVNNLAFYQDFSLKFNHSSMPFFRRMCLLGQYNPQYIEFAKKYQMEDSLAMMCDLNNQESLAYLESQARVLINDQFHCNNTRTYCTDKEIAVMQVTSQAITRLLDPQLSKYLLWKDPYGHQGVDLLSFSQKYGLWPSLQKENLYSWGVSQLNFQQLFMVLTVQKGLLNMTLGQSDQVSSFFSLEQVGMPPVALMDWIRYMAMQVGLGGFTRELSVHDLLYGYEIDLFKQMSTLDPAMGGNPFQPTGKELGIAQNFTEEQALSLVYTMKSGKDDYRLARRYLSSQHSQYITYMDIQFNGNTSSTVYPVGWEQPIPLDGTDGFLNRANIDKDNIDVLNIFVAPLWRNAKVKRSGQRVDHFGVDSARFNLARETTQPKSIYPPNAVYWEDKIDGFLNCSQQMKGPMFQSKMNFLHVDPKYRSKVQIFADLEKTQQLHPQESEDESYLDVEPYTGMSIGAWLKLQFNMYFQDSGLLLQKGNPKSDIVIPIIGFIRGADIPEEFSDGMLYPLKLALALKFWVQVLSIVIGATGMLGLTYYLYLTNKNVKTREYAADAP